MKYAVFVLATAIFLSPSLTARKSFADTTSLPQIDSSSSFAQEQDESADADSQDEIARVNRSPAVLGPPIVAPAQPTSAEMGYIYYDYTDEIPVGTTESESGDR